MKGTRAWRERPRLFLKQGVKRLFLIGMAYATFFSEAAQVSEAFSSRAQMVSATAIWNQALGVVHPTLKVTGYTGGATPDVAVNVGDGSHGAFVQSRYTSFSVNGDTTGNIIQLDTTVYPELKVTEFVLESGWTLVPVGGNPLVIRSLSDVKIRGEIWCHGQDGSASSGATGGAGGSGRCGGAAGGAGGNTGLSGIDGGDSTAPVTGGLGGTANGGGAGIGGGGGGAWNLTSLAGNGPGFTGVPGSGGERGTSSSDPEFDTLAAGAGGGGGGAGSAGAGGGGGGGGGLVIIHAVRDFELGSSTDPNVGYIFASGGNGADSAGNGGGGGGGGGGSVQIFAGGVIRMYNVNTGMAAGRALGGQNPAPNVAASGGSGRNWYTSVSFSGGGFYDPAEEAPVIPGDFAEFSTAAQTVESGSYDLLNTLADVTSITTTPASADFALQWKGSSDNFASDDTGWSSSTAVLAQKRYVKFRFTVTNSSATAPTFLDAVTVSYAPGTRELFDFKSAAGCGAVNGGGSPWNLLWIFWPMLLMLAYRFRVRQ